MTTSPRRITVLLGGYSSEREVSLSSGQGIARALRARGYDVSELDAGQPLDRIVAGLQEQKPDVVFNGLHGRFGEDGSIQGILEWMRLPYTHSGIRASAVAMDKNAARQLFQAAGLPVARGTLVTPDELETSDPLPLPYVVKPLSEGSSVGVSILRKGDNRRADIARSWTWGPQILAEEFIPGREITVGVLEDESRVPHALTVTDITPDASAAFYDYDAKYKAGGSRHVLPAEIPADIFAEARRIAVEAHRTLGCAGASRTDFRYDDTLTDGSSGRLVILEVNTQPGMTATSLLPEQAAYCGISYEDLCERLVMLAGTGL
ncbi:D-alanine--D-alanine ligase [Acetobacter sp. AN02]|uniref:D-alanine--D-alanine ligase n=1 Tax=Acetobacter sp. AN02 TaxID=2894186 RepID=UPI0024343061|nr:D-alanine--D-alanine ligase [Acetobacter sp. AN02]MDG6094218.1 D-alanine--D-alanine ligase [Acetobacter sp. AN02]